MKPSSNHAQTSSSHQTLSNSVFWGLTENQDQLLARTETFATEWFARRQEATHAAVEAMRSMSKAQTPFQAFLEYQAWARGAAERIAADCAALHSCVLRTTADVVRPAPDAAVEFANRDARPA